MYHWTDRKIRIHAFYCMLGISLLQYVHKQAQIAWADLSVEQLLQELQQIKQFVLLYPRQGDKGPPAPLIYYPSRPCTQRHMQLVSTASPRSANNSDTCS
jgi:hypothetical protein